MPKKKTTRKKAARKPAKTSDTRRVAKTKFPTDLPGTTRDPRTGAAYTTMRARRTTDTGKGLASALRKLTGTQDFYDVGEELKRVITRIEAGSDSASPGPRYQKRPTSKAARKKSKKKK